MGGIIQTVGIFIAGIATGFVWRDRISKARRAKGARELEQIKLQPDTPALTFLLHDRPLKGGPPLRETVTEGEREIGGRLFMSNNVLAKLAAIVVVLIGLAVWRSSERLQSPICGDKCPTDISAIHR